MGTNEDVLFGERPLEACLNVSQDALAQEPYTSFSRAKEAMGRDAKVEAISILQSIVSTPQFEPLSYLQAWHFLRNLGVEVPPDKAKDVLSVLVEAGVNGGVDLVAAYPDHRARYYNFSGAAVVWERPNNELDATIDEVFRSAGALVPSVGIWNKAKPLAPPEGQVRINLLTPGGLRFGQAPINVIAKDPLGASTLAAAFQLMRALMRLSKK